MFKYIKFYITSFFIINQLIFFCYDVNSALSATSGGLIQDQFHDFTTNFHIFIDFKKVTLDI